MSSQMYVAVLAAVARLHADGFIVPAFLHVRRCIFQPGYRDTSPQLSTIIAPPGHRARMGNRDSRFDLSFLARPEFAPSSTNWIPPFAYSKLISPTNCVQFRSQYDET
ncbi:hypothetical protein FB45DRAFT_1034857 [Roridomyces roridus]|uniref:Uncharacterized protein n=1 Tax=Roridomyces roridus TaxID=1738132 RepID=A0AAD7BBX7_9AGAR|nr:hypothetical protein FB45DRAFT_1034857 [Roridomyces roridus]